MNQVFKKIQKIPFCHLQNAVDYSQVQDTIVVELWSSVINKISSWQILTDFQQHNLVLNTHIHLLLNLFLPHGKHISKSVSIY